MSTLKQRSDRYCIVFNDTGADFLKSARHILNQIQKSELPYTFIAVIKHDRDKREDDPNSLKTVHYHMVLQSDGIFRLETMLNKLSDILKINKNQISIDKCTSIEMQTRYLVHLDDFDKEPYDVWDIATSSNEILHRYMKLKIIKDLTSLINFVREKHYDLELIMSEIANYDKWRKYINDLLVNYSRKGRL